MDLEELISEHADAPVERVAADAMGVVVVVSMVTVIATKVGKAALNRIFYFLCPPGMSFNDRVADLVVQRSGFCIKEREREREKVGTFKASMDPMRVYIDSEHWQSCGSAASKCIDPSSCANRVTLFLGCTETWACISTSKRLLTLLLLSLLLFPLWKPS